MKIALVHDWLNTLGGAERVLIELHKIFPQAPIYTLFANKKFTDEFLPKADIRPSFIQNIPFARKFYKYLLPLMPVAVESFDLSDFDLVISSSVNFAKGLVLKPKTKHICYCYSPTRFLWDQNTEYQKHHGDKGENYLIRLSQHFLRIWDRQTADRVDKFVAISEHVRDRIKKYYRKDSEVIYPPVSISSITNYELRIKDEKSAIRNAQYYLIVSRLFPHKNIDIAIETFNKLGLPLVVIGDGPEKKKLRKIARKNIKILGYEDDSTIAKYYQNCRAFIMPQEEDFGITPIEAMSFGKPVLALRKGGAIETITEGVTGEFFDDPIPEGLADGIRRLNDNYSKYNIELIKSQAQKFSLSKFQEEISRLVYNS